MHYTYTHIFSFAESNAVGNIYFAELVALQGRCREAFLQEYAPKTTKQLVDKNDPVYFVTKECSIKCRAEFFPFDKVEVRLWSGLVTNIKIEMLFEYWLVGRKNTPLAEPKLACEGRQLVKCLPRIPDDLNAAVRQYPRQAVERFEARANITVPAHA